MPIPVQVWEDISMDFIVSLPLARAYYVIMVVVDRLTKYSHFVCLKLDFDSRYVANNFVQNIMKLHGFPKSIVFERDKISISRFRQQLFKLQGTKLAMTSTYHPQTDGQREVLDKTFEMLCKCSAIVECSGC